MHADREEIRQALHFQVNEATKHERQEVDRLVRQLEEIDAGLFHDLDDAIGCLLCATVDAAIAVGQEAGREPERLALVSDFK